MVAMAMMMTVYVFFLAYSRLQLWADRNVAKREIDAKWKLPPTQMEQDSDLKTRNWIEFNIISTREIENTSEKLKLKFSSRKLKHTQRIIFLQYFWYNYNHKVIKNILKYINFNSTQRKYMFEL